VKKSKNFYVYILNSDSNEIRQEVCLSEKYLFGRPDAITVAVNEVIKRNGGVRRDEKIKITFQNPQELRSTFQL